MPDNQTNLLTDELIFEQGIPRKKMLPQWIKIFAWIFIVISGFAPIVSILGVFGIHSELALYGMETNESFSLPGILITTLFVIKGVTAFGLLKEKDWAIKMGLLDAVIGIIVCAIVMIYSIINTDVKFSLRLELAVLIPYLLKLLNIKSQWENYLKISD